MKRLALLLPVAVALIAVFLPPKPAHACTRKNGKLVCGDSTTPVVIKGTLFVDGPPAGNDGGSGFTQSGRGTLVYDFPSIPATGANSACQDSAAGTAPGCRFGDTVTLGIDQVVPAKNGPPPVAWISAANQFTVRVCNTSTDAGAVDMPDASYTVRCFR